MCTIYKSCVEWSVRIIVVFVFGALNPNLVLANNADMDQEHLQIGITKLVECIAEDNLPTQTNRCIGIAASHCLKRDPQPTSPDAIVASVSSCYDLEREFWGSRIDRVILEIPTQLAEKTLFNTSTDPGQSQVSSLHTQWKKYQSSLCDLAFLLTQETMTRSLIKKECSMRMTAEFAIWLETLLFIAEDNQ